jgi:selenide,water dikinase
VLSALPRRRDPRVLVDYATGDDAGVYLLDGRTALVQTVDFFTPVVDDPAAFGAVAAANALSDVYAMGGRPLTALSIAAFPERDFPREWAAAIVAGGQAKLEEAGCALLGGHTVRDPELKFGYAITGLVDAERVLTNAAGRAGEVLVLTKPLGTGVVATALKAGRARPEHVAAATAAMTTLNRAASEAALRHGVRGATDVTGFGLAGHAAALARESRLTLELSLAALPLLPGAAEYALGHQAGGLHANRSQYAPLLDDRAAEDAVRRALLFDPQTSGGLLLLVPEPELPGLLAELPEARAVGRALPPGPHPLRLV